MVLTDHDFDQLDFHFFFNTVTGLRDLSLSLEEPRNQPSFRATVESMSIGELLRRLSEHPNLQRLESSGISGIDGKDLVRFDTSRVGTLRCLILNETQVFSDWDTFSRSIARVTSGITMFLKVWLPGDFMGKEDVPSVANWGASLGFSYPFVWVNEA
jgi:hypothetical protein